MNLQYLKFAIAVADTKSFTQAADICCVTQPTLSNGIGQLEDELGGKLFERTTRSVKITDFGEMMIKKMQEVVASQRNLLTSAADHLARSNTTIRIGMSPLISSDFSKSMLDRVAKTNLELVFVEMNKADIGPALQGGTIDFGLCPTPMQSNNLQSSMIYSEPLFVVSDQKSDDENSALQLSELVGKKLLMVPDDCGLSDTVRNLFQHEKLAAEEYEGRALAYHVLEKWAHLGIGVTLLPASKLLDASFARPLKSMDGRFAEIKFQACWNREQETRKSFSDMMVVMGILV